MVDSFGYVIKNRFVFQSNYKYMVCLDDKLFGILLYQMVRERGGQIVNLIEMAEDYLYFSRVGVYGLPRWEKHQAILRKLGLEVHNCPEKITQVNEILHNLDREIGFNVDIEYDENDIHKMAKKLVRKMKKIKGEFN